MRRSGRVDVARGLGQEFKSGECKLYVLVLIVRLIFLLLHRQWEMYRCRYPGSSFLGALASYDMTRKEVEAAEEKVVQKLTISNDIPWI